MNLFLKSTILYVWNVFTICLIENPKIQKNPSKKQDKFLDKIFLKNVFLKNGNFMYTYINMFNFLTKYNIKFVKNYKMATNK